MPEKNEPKVQKNEVFNTDTAVAAQEAKIERANRVSDKRGVTPEAMQRSVKDAK